MHLADVLKEAQREEEEGVNMNEQSTKPVSVTTDAEGGDGHGVHKARLSGTRRPSVWTFGKHQGNDLERAHDRPETP